MLLIDRGVLILALSAQDLEVSLVGILHPIGAIRVQHGNS
jgi:hypothetical protein